MGLFDDFDVEITRLPAPGTDLTLARKLNARSSIYTWRNRDRNGSTCPHPTIARTFHTWMRNCGAESLTLRARPRSHHLPKEGSLDLLDFPAPTAHGTYFWLGVGRSSVPLTGITCRRGIHGDFPGNTEHCIV
jgi:hypothetical protein